MIRFSNVLIPTDFSVAAKNALSFIVKLIEGSGGAKISLLYISDNELSDKEKEALESDFKALTKDIETNGEIQFEYTYKTGHLTEQILKSRSEIGADVIVMGTKGSKEREEIASSNTSELVLNAACPVIVIPDDYTNFSMKNIALLLDNNVIEDSNELSLLHNIAREFSSSIHVLTIETDENPILDIDKHAGTLEYYLETLNYHHVFPKNSDIEKGIHDYVKANSIDLLVILPRIHAKKTKPSEGRLVKILTLRSEVPLLSID